MHLTSLLVAVKGEIEARGCGLSLLLYNQRAKHPLIIVVLRRMWLVFGSRTGDNDNLNESHGHKGFFFPPPNLNRAIDKQLSPKVPSTFS